MCYTAVLPEIRWILHINNKEEGEMKHFLIGLALCATLLPALAQTRVSHLRDRLILKQQVKDSCAVLRIHLEQEGKTTQTPDLPLSSVLCLVSAFERQVTDNSMELKEADARSESDLRTYNEGLRQLLREIRRENAYYRREIPQP